MVSEIMSLQHPLVKEWVRLRSDKSTRAESGQVLLIGAKMVQELSEKTELHTLISTKPFPHIRAKEHVLVHPSILQKITGVPAPDGIAAIASIPKPRSLEGRRKILILDRIADPGNLGTLLRTALALNWDGVVFTPGTVDPFNDKALRASKGALFSLPYCHLSQEELTSLVKPLYIYVADLDGTPLTQVTVEEPFALVLSNEGAGARLWNSEKVGKISIPMHNHVESLNVAMSGSILLYSMGQT
jgi:TrmH family RNA methyltransferase